MVTDHLVVFGDGTEFYLRHDMNDLIVSCLKSAEQFRESVGRVAV